MKIIENLFALMKINTVYLSGQTINNKQKFSKMKAYPNTDLSSITTSHPLFKAVEQQFDEWYNHNTQPGAPLAKDIKGCYYGYFDEPACFSKVGAIEQAIEEMINEADETGKPVSVNTFDFDAVFQI